MHSKVIRMGLSHIFEAETYRKAVCRKLRARTDLNWLEREGFPAKLSLFDLIEYTTLCDTPTIDLAECYGSFAARFVTFPLLPGWIPA